MFELSDQRCTYHKVTFDCLGIKLHGFAAHYTTVLFLQ